MSRLMSQFDVSKENEDGNTHGSQGIRDSVDGGRILVVDDDQDVLLFVSRALQRAGFEVETCGDYFEAEELVRTNSFDVVISDISMPGKDGIDLLKIIKTVQPDTPVVLITGFPSVETASEAVRQDAYDYLSKPFPPEGLVRAAKRACETKRLRDKTRRMEEDNKSYQQLLEHLVAVRTQRLSESEKRYRCLFDDSKDAILITDIDGRFVDFNRSALELFGYDEAELRGINVRDVYSHPADLLLFQDMLEKHGSLKDYEVRYKRKDGTELICLVTFSLRRSENGGLAGYQGIVHDVTSRKRAEEQILRQNELLTNVLESLSHPFYVVDTADCSVVLANSAAHRGNLTRGTSCHSLAHRRDGPCTDHGYSCPLDMVKRTKGPVIVEHLHYDSEGSLRYFEVHGYPVFDSDGNVVQMIEYCLDITDRKRAEDALKKNETKFREFFNHSPFMMYSCDDEGYIRDVNRKWVEQTGYPASEAIGRRMDFLMAPESSRRLSAMGLLGACGQGSVCDLALRYIRKDGTAMDVLLNCNTTTDPSGEKRGLSTVQDVTEKRRTQEELYRLKAAIEHSLDSIVITDADWIIQYVNPSFTRITGFRRDEAIGRHYLRFQGVLVDSIDRHDMERTLRSGSPYDAHCLGCRKDGSKYEEEIIFSPILEAGGGVINYVVMKRDVTEKRRLESIAEAANLMDNIGFCFSGIRHEIGNPLNTIKMTLNVLDKNLNVFDHKKTAEFIHRALIEVRRVEYLLKSLKSFSLFENPRITNVQLISFMEKLLSLTEEDFAKKGVKIGISFSPQAKWVETDPRALQQVMLNLLINAADALADVEDPRIHIRTEKMQGLVRIVVEDNGRGMSEEQQKNLFKPFYTTKPEGTGLGLVIVRKMLTRMNGSIEIKSRESQGARVTLSLPEGVAVDG